MFLISAVPYACPRQRGLERPVLTSEIPSPMNLPAGSPFARDICRLEDPARQQRDGRMVASRFPLDA